MADHDELQATAATSTEETRVSTGQNRIRESEDKNISLGVDALDYDYTNFYFGSGEDAFALLEPFKAWWEQVHPRGYYQYELPLHSAPATRGIASSATIVSTVDGFPNVRLSNSGLSGGTIPSGTTIRIDSCLGCHITLADIFE